MIEVKGLTKRYGDREVLHGLDFSVPVGRVCGFLGPNGSGKSTTMDILSGLLGPSDGEAKVCGYDVVTQSRDVRANIGYLSDNPPLYKDMRVRDFVTYTASLRGIRGQARRDAVDRVLAECAVDDVADRIVGNLSKGYRQRVALCSALVHQPKVLVLDEPTEGLDPNQIVQIRNLIRTLARDRAVIMSSHILSEVQETCVDVIIIHQGRIVAKTTIGGSADSQVSQLFTFQKNAPGALSWFQAQGFVAKAELEVGQSVRVDFKAEGLPGKPDEVIARVNSQLVGEGFSVCGIQPHRAGLEALFFDVIKQQPGSRGGQETGEGVRP